MKATTFDVRICHQIFKRRKDTRLVLIDIPDISEAESNSKYRNYVESNWNIFDSVLVVMNGTSVDTDLLKFVKDNNEKLKDIPTIILGKSWTIYTPMILSKRPVRKSSRSLTILITNLFHTRRKMEEETGQESPTRKNR